MTMVGHGVDMIQRRGALLPASSPQERCDGCGKPLDPQAATEVTVTTPSKTVRFYGHGTAECSKGVAAHVAVQTGGAK